MLKNFDLVFFNGDIQPIEQVKISPLDRGYLFGDSIYEVFSVIKGKIFRWEYHRKRLEASLKQAYMSFDCDSVNKVIQRLADANNLATQSCFCYFHISRGTMLARDLAFDSEISMNCFVMLMDASSSSQKSVAPVSLNLQDDSRWSQGQIKATSLLGATLHKHKAIMNGYDDALLHRDQKICEATASNFFCVIDGEITTPKLNRYLLAGVTRAYLIDELAKQGIAVVERDILCSEIPDMSEAWITSSIKELLLVEKIEDAWENNSFPVWQECNSLYQERKRLFTLNI